MITSGSGMIPSGFFFEQEQNQNYNLLYDYHGLHMESVSLPSVDEGGRGESWTIWLSTT